MDVMPILSALRRNKVGAVLIALQLALTLAIVSNALFIISQRLSYVSRPTGIAEPDIVVLNNNWIGQGLDYKPLLDGGPRDAARRAGRGRRVRLELRAALERRLEHRRQIQARSRSAPPRRPRSTSATTTA
jgi:hypothetical protein